MTTSTLVGRRRFRARLAILSVSTILAAGCALPAAAQLAAPAPIRQSIDGNGVDLFRGTMNVQAPALTIGQDEPQGLSYYKINRGGAWADNIVAAMNFTAGVMTVSLGGVSDAFTVSGTTYTSVQGNGATLTFNSSAKIYTYIRADGTVIRFDKNRFTPAPYYANEGRVIDIIRPSGAKLVFSYASMNFCSQTKPGKDGDVCMLTSTAYRVASVRNSYGYALNFNYDEIDPYDPTEPSTMPDLATWSAVVGVSASNLAAASTGAMPFESFATTSTYNVTDALGRVTKYRMDSGGVGGVTLPGSTSEDVSVTYAAGRVASVNALAAGATSYSWSDASGVRTATVTNALSETTLYRFDIGSGLMTSMTDAFGRVTSWQYDGSGRMTRATQPEGNYTQVSYDARGNVAENRAVSKTPGTPADIVTTATFDATCSVAVKCNRPNSTTDARGNVTDYTYDSGHGGVLSVTAPAAISGGVRPQIRYSYASLQALFRNSSGSIVASGEPIVMMTGSSTCRTGASCAGTSDEVVSSLGYGPQSTGVGNNLLPVSSSSGSGDGTLTATTMSAYDTIGNLISVDGPLPGSDDTTTYRYDTARRQVGVISADPDGAGPLKRRALRTTYTPRDQVTESAIGTVTDASDTAWNNFAQSYRSFSGYDSRGRMIRQTSWSNGVDYGVWDYLYDAVGRLTCSIAHMNPASWGPQASSCTPLQTTGPMGPDRVTLTQYSAASTSSPASFSVTTAYGTAAASTEAVVQTANGKTARVIDGNGNVTTYAYDGFDRLLQTHYPVTTTGGGTSSASDYEQLGYDAGSNVVSRRLRDGQTINYGYDALNRVTLKDLPGAEADISYSYDLLGRPAVVQKSTLQHSFVWDALGRQLAEYQPFGSIVSQFDLAGRRTRQTWNDGFYVTFDYDTTGNMTAIRENGAASGIGVLASYSYDDLGRRTGIVRGNGATTAYAFDAVSRLSSLAQDLSGTAGDLSLGFAYNPASQITTTTRSNDAYAWTGAVNVDRAYTANGLNQLTTSGPVALGYDARGNLTGSGSTGYSYSSENRLTGVSNGSTLYYDALGRLAEYDTTISTRFMYDGSQMASEYFNGSATVARRYVYGPGTDEPLVWYEGSSTSDRRWLHADERGSVIAVSDGSGATIATNSYDEYGIPAAGNSGRFQYTGQAFLPEIGLSYYKARMYSPTLGRFMQPDPIGYGDGMNWYNYVGGDPVNKSDPTGLFYKGCSTLEWCQVIWNKGGDSGYWIPGKGGVEGSEQGIGLTANAKGWVSTGEFIGLGRRDIWDGHGSIPFLPPDDGGDRPQNDDCAHRNSSGECDITRDRDGKLHNTPEKDKKDCQNYKAMMQSNREVSRYTGGAAQINGARGLTQKMTGSKLLVTPLAFDVLMYGVGLTTYLLGQSPPPAGCK